MAFMRAFGRAFRRAVSDQTDVSLSLTEHVSTKVARRSNLVFSPLSLQVVLSLVASGSDGPTLKQLLSFLKAKSAADVSSFSSEAVEIVFADGVPSGGPSLSFANGVWVDKSMTLKPSFKKIAENVYKAACNEVDFQKKAAQVRDEVNAWAEKETSGLIKEVLPPGSVDPLMTRLVLANALYFKGAWSQEFDASKTKDHDFHLLDGTVVQAQFMTSKKKQLLRSFNGFTVLGLPYKRGEDKRSFSMYIFLPDTKDGLQSLVKKVGSEPGFLGSHLPYERVPVGDFRIPKFKISFEFEASNILMGLGLQSPFLEGGLREMVDSPLGDELFISGIFHKAIIEVNEEGTEAAAASGTMFAGCARWPPPPSRIDFIADHPFLFLIREDATGVVLFVGHVLNPLAG